MEEKTLLLIQSALARLSEQQLRLVYQFIRGLLNQ